MTLPKEVDISRITDRCRALKENFRAINKPLKNWVVFKNGSVVAVPITDDSEVVAKNSLVQCVSNHPDFSLITTNETIPCHILVMSGYRPFQVVTYLFDDEWEKEKTIKTLGVSEQEWVMFVGTYARERIFKDAKDPQVHEIV